jgi:hypothetical protein
VRDFDIADMGCKPTGRVCDNGACGGPLRGMTIDWDSPLPDAEFERAIDNHKQADLAICLVRSQHDATAAHSQLRIGTRALRLQLAPHRRAPAPLLTPFTRICVCLLLFAAGHLASH